MKSIAHLFGVPTKDELQQRAKEQGAKEELDDWHELARVGGRQDGIAAAVLAGSAFIGAIAVFDAAKTTDHRVAVASAFISALFAATSQSITVEQKSFFARDGAEGIEAGRRRLLRKKFMLWVSEMALGVAFIALELAAMKASAYWLIGVFGVIGVLYLIRQVR